MLLSIALASLIAQRSTAPGPSPSPEGGGIMAFLGILCYIVVIVGFWALMWWKVFEKAGYPGWASIVPIYNLVIVLQMGGQNPLWLLVLLIPICGGFVFLYPLIMANIEIAKRFGQGAGFAVGLILLGIVFFPILGFGSAQYRAPGIVPGRG